MPGDPEAGAYVGFRHRFLHPEAHAQGVGEHSRNPFPPPSRGRHSPGPGRSGCGGDRTSTPTAGTPSPGVAGNRHRPTDGRLVVHVPHVRDLAGGRIQFLTWARHSTCCPSAGHPSREGSELSRLPSIRGSRSMELMLRSSRARCPTAPDGSSQQAAAAARNSRPSIPRSVHIPDPVFGKRLLRSTQGPPGGQEAGLPS